MAKIAKVGYYLDNTKVAHDLPYNSHNLYFDFLLNNKFKVKNLVLNEKNTNKILKKSSKASKDLQQWTIFVFSGWNWN